MKLTHKILMVGIISLMSACENMAPEFPDENPVPQDCTPQFPEMDITYDNYVKNIIASKCIICHAGGNTPGTGNFSTYAGVKPHLDQFFIRVIQDRADMPQGMAPLPKSTRDSLDIWIKNCAPEK
jgi:hypothetical protein